ncbi:hypothetical protein [Paenibacillus terrae]|uniref:hypothetical protein n=1 Tax=Paenibacillus terrae TaxID=159743 RepID=UPI000B111640|nr:hypothetical protein [Paenibacillus terrae]
MNVVARGWLRHGTFDNKVADLLCCGGKFPLHKELIRFNEEMGFIEVKKEGTCYGEKT